MLHTEFFMLCVHKISFLTLHTWEEPCFGEISYRYPLRKSINFPWVKVVLEDGEEQGSLNLAPKGHYPKEFKVSKIPYYVGSTFD